MILLSNHRLIPIKQIQLTNPDSAAQKEEETLQSLQNQINQAKTRLAALQEEIVQRKKTAEEDMKGKREQWEKERENFIAEAQQLGYQQGFDQGKLDSVQQYKQMIEEAIQVLNKSNEEYSKIIAESDETILQIAMAVSKKIMKQSLAEDPAKFLPITKALIDQVKSHPQITLLVSPAYYPLLVDNKDELSSIMAEQEKFRIYPSLELKGEQVIIETPFGRIDASIDSQLEEVKNRLFHVMEEMIRENPNHSERD